ncbi:LPS-assembly protein LptD [Piscinibacter sakaiensis]|uniref:LPS-assembly protein LptD n=1 Tax=Piscinibacter sakaiensis TaxID=1547922 RepID=UPI003AAC00AF
MPEFRRPLLIGCSRLLIAGVLASGAPLAGWSQSAPADRPLPIVLEAREITGRPDLDAVARGDAEFQRGEVTITADELSFDYPDALARAVGNVRISRDGNVYSGPELQLKVQTYEGFFLQPTYFFSRTGAGGHAERVDFLDRYRATAQRATYSSCQVDDRLDAQGRYVGPAWELSTRRLKMDFDANEGIAEGAVLRFYGVPILAAPVLSFPLTDARKSGWLPPSIAIDSNSGLQVAAPYYWNIAPNRDATLTPTVIAKRGVGVDSEFRYLEPRFSGKLDLDLLPADRLAGRDRYALGMQHDHALPSKTRVSLRVLRVSDDDYWKDFSENVPSLTPRLLLSDLQASRPIQVGKRGGEWTAYARVQRWQVLQNSDLASRIEAPYDRLPQVGVRTAQQVGPGLRIEFNAEFNRFVNPTDVTGGVRGVPTGALVGPTGLRGRPTGDRIHALGSISRPWVTPGWTLTPKLSFNAASYSLDQPLANGSTGGSRVIPTASLDSAWVLERDTEFFGRSLRQTLEPRLLYVNTPYRQQRDFPVFDTAVKDFNFDSIYTESRFTGIDRISDAHQLTAGVTSRMLDPASGAELMRFGVAQRMLFRDQRITADGLPTTQRFSDLLLLGRTTLVPRWTLDSSVQYNPDLGRVVRSVASARYSPGPFRTVSATYRLTRGLSEQLELGWQWPLYGPVSGGDAPARTLQTEGSACGGSLYGVGRINYSTSDRRITDSIIGLEYDAGCWIGRIVAERLSTGRSEATTRLLLQLELVGLSRLGSSPLQVLKDNIPGYRLLRESTPIGSNAEIYE